jgi:hypothetical protein
MLARSLLVAACTGASLLAQTPVAYAVDTDQDILYSLDLGTGAVTSIGSTLNNGMATPADLCWMDDTNEIWTVDLAGGEAGTIDPLTGTFTLRWATNLSGWQAMAWDHTTRLFWLHNQSGTLYTLDPVTGTLATIGVTTGHTLCTAMEVDAFGRLFLLNFSTGAIVQVDKATAQPISVLASTPTNVQGLAISPEGVWYGIATNTDSLYVIDPNAGTSTLVGPCTGTIFVKGMVITGSNVQRGGRACADGSGASRRLTWTGNSNLGNFLLFDWDLAPTPALGFLAFGISSSFGPLPLPLDLGAFGAPGCSLYQSLDATGPVGLAGNPTAFVIPNVASLVGFNVWVQGVLVDGSATPNALGLMFTDGVKLTVVP